MSELRNFVADLLERKGAAVDKAVDPDGLEVLAPAPVQKATGWPELTRLSFGRERSHGAIPIGLEGDWLDRFGALLEDEGRWSERAVSPAGALPAPSDPGRLLDRALDLPNAVWRFQGMTATWTRCLMLAFRYTAVSDEKREGLIWLGLNLGTGAVVNDILVRLRPALAQVLDWQAPDQATRLAAGSGWSAATLEARLRPLLDRQVRDCIEPFLRAMRRRLERIATGSMPITTTCAVRRSSGLRRWPVRKEIGRRPIGGAKPCGSRRSSANTVPNSMICATTTPFASPSNGFRRWTFTCRCNASTC